MKKFLIHGVTAGVLAGIAGIVYQKAYEGAMLLDFSAIINPGSIVGASIFGCILMAIGYGLLERFKKTNLKGWLNVLIAILSFLSILGPLSMSLPLEVESPEMLPGLAIPMHFFPAMIFFGLNPFFTKPRLHE